MLPPVVCDSGSAQQGGSEPAEQQFLRAGTTWQGSLRTVSCNARTGRSRTSLAATRRSASPERSSTSASLSVPQGTYGSSWWQSPMPSLDVLQNAPLISPGIASRLGRDRHNMMGEGTRLHAATQQPMGRASFYGSCSTLRKAKAGELLPVTRTEGARLRDKASTVLLEHKAVGRSE